MAGKRVVWGFSVLLCLLFGTCSLGTDIETLRGRVQKDKSYTVSYEYTVRFDSNGGSSVSSQTVNSGGTATRPADPTKIGFRFDNWYSNSGLTTLYNFSTAVTGNITLYAKWNSVPTYTVSFESNGGSSVTSQTVNSGGTATRPANPTKSGYAFDNWYSNSGLTTVYNFSTAVTGNITLYAKWNIAYTITFDSNGGSNISSQTVNSGGTATRPTDPTKIGFRFDNWYSNSGLTTLYNFSTVVTGNITLYAKWNPINIEMVNVPGGSFQMGNPDSTVGDPDERPVHTVTLTGFYMGKYEVTQEQYQAVMGALPSSLTSGSYGKGGNYPVYYVSWYDALVFCNRLSMAEELTPAYRINNSTDPAQWGTVPASSNSTWDAAEIVSGSTGYRLPTEAQWEYAAKGGDGTPGNYTYSGSNTVGDVAWYSGNNGSIGTSNYGSKAVGTKAPNGLGIYDMSGNVWEWCWDWYGGYTSGAQTDPVGAATGGDRVLRGGGWYSNASYARSVYRSYSPPYGRYDSSGFRLVRPQ